MIRTMFRHIRRSPYQALAAISTLTLTVLVASIFIITSFGAEKILLFFEQKPQVTAFLTDKIQKEEIESLKKEIQDTGKIANIKYISKEEALEIYKKQNKNDPLLLEMVTASILPASLEVSTRNLNDLKEIHDLLKTKKIIEEVVYQKDIVENLSSWINNLRVAGLIFTGVLLLNSLLTILTIIAFKIAQRKGEVEILFLLGATKWQARMPFILEGGVYGFISSLFSIGLIISILINIGPFLAVFLAGTGIFPLMLSDYLSLMAISLFVGLFIGLFGSFMAVIRYL